MALSRLTFANLTTIKATATLPPILEATPESSELLTCPICLEFKPGKMVSHLPCMRLFCVDCILTLINDSQNCPLCREATSEPFVSTYFARPPPVEQSFIDNVDYYCGECKEKLKYEAAKVHHQTCPRGPERHQPPNYIQPRGQEPLLMREVVSNPIAIDKPPTNRRLLVLHHNGNQIKSKYFENHKTALDVKREIANVAGAALENIKLFKFIHKEISDATRVATFATNHGANYLTSLENFDELGQRSANIILHEMGPPPRIERPQENEEPVQEPSNSGINFWLNRQQY